MKIALIGSHGTGKTTAVHELISILKKNSFDAGYLEETVRSCPFPINDNATEESQKWIFYEHFARELEFGRKSEILVCDRSLLDIYAYYYRKFGRNKAMEELVKENIGSYSLLFYFPLGKFNNRLSTDGVRSVDIKFQKEIDVLVANLLKEFNPVYSVYENSEKAFNEIVKLKSVV